MLVNIIGLTPQGEGIGRIDNKVVFIPHVLPGETVDAKIILQKAKYSRGRMREIIETVPERIEPRCPYFFECGGCQYQHMDYENELICKVQAVQETLARIAHIKVDNLTIEGGKQPWYYRNKATWHLKVDRYGNQELGFYQTGSQSIIPLTSCFLLDEKINEIASDLPEQLKNIRFTNNYIDLTLRAAYDHKTMLIVSSAERLEGNDMKEFLKSSADAVYFHNDREEGSLRGAPYLHEEINDIKYRLAPMSFWQVNRSQNQRLIELVSELLLLRGDERVLDAYCGVGSISLQIARQSKKVVGIEAYLPAVTDALHNMQLNGLQNCNFIRGCCEDLLYKMTDVFDAVILDPPRSGCHKRVIGALIKKSIPRILYISCNPASLARDLQLLQAGGYEISQIRLLDMFPHTAHVESIVLMTNSGFKDR